MDLPAINAVLRINDELETLAQISFKLPNGVTLNGRTLSAQQSSTASTASAPTHVILSLHGYLDNCHSFATLIFSIANTRGLCR